MADESPRAAIRAELDSTRNAYHHLLERLTDADWRRPSGNPAWTVGEIMAQLIDAVVYLPRSIALARSGRSFSPQPVMAKRMNTRVTRTMARRVTREAAGARYDEAHSALCALLDSIQDDEWASGARLLGKDETVAGLFHSLPAHFAEQQALVEQGLAGGARL